MVAREVQKGNVFSVVNSVRGRSVFTLEADRDHLKKGSLSGCLIHTGVHACIKGPDQRGKLILVLFKADQICQEYILKVTAGD